jgi:acetolactate synthase regulatory subunit
MSSRGGQELTTWPDRAMRHCTTAADEMTERHLLPIVSASIRAVQTLFRDLDKLYDDDKKDLHYLLKRLNVKR